MKKLTVVLAAVVFVFGAQLLACNSGKPWMAFLPPEDQAQILEAIRAAAVQSAKEEAASQKEQVPPPPPPPVFVQADSLSLPELSSDYEVAIPAQAQPIQMDEVVVIS